MEHKARLRLVMYRYAGRRWRSMGVQATDTAGRRATRPRSPRIESVLMRAWSSGWVASCMGTSVAISVVFGLWAPPVHAQPPTCAWTDNPIVSGQTPIKAQHINELRACLDAILANWPGTTDTSVPRPTIAAIVFNNSPVEGDTYRGGEDISVGLRFSEQVRITGRPRLALTIGNAVRQATTYQDSSPMDFRSFRYAVQADDLDTDGLGIAADALTLNGGSIRSLTGVDAVLNLGSHSVAVDPTRKVDGGTGGPVGGSILDCPLKVAGNGYAVCHVEGYADDAEFVRGVLGPAATRLSQRFRPTTTPVDLYLFPEPGTVHGITIQPGTALAYGGPRHLAIYLMARSAPAMRGACCTGLGLPSTDLAYQRTVLVHELSTAFIHHYPGYTKWAGWFVQGLEQYEGLEAAGTLWQRAAERVWRDDSVACGRSASGDERLVVSERYWAGALLLRYFAARFGEDSHVRILQSRRGTLTEAITDEQPPGESPCELFDDWRAWMRNSYRLGG